MTVRFAQVALPLPLFEPYTYSVPETLADRITPGARVVVPVRRRELVGIVLATHSDPPSRETREVLAAPDAEPALSGPLPRTAEWMAGYYGAPIGLALKAMIPAPMWGASRVLIRVTEAGPTGRLGGLAEQLGEWLDPPGGGGPSGVRMRGTEAGPTGRLGGLAEQLVEWLDRRGGEAPLDTAARHFRKPLWEVADRLGRGGAPRAPPGP